jgi:hypothetical protein
MSRPSKGKRRDRHHDHAHLTEHGEGDHAQLAVQGEGGRGQLPGREPAAYLELMPGCETPCFEWASPNAVKVWHARFDHARRCGVWRKLAETPTDGHCQESHLYCIWAVDLVARTLALNRNTVGSALKELVDLGWLRKSTLRNKGGTFSGFEYVILPPPKEPTKAALHRYAEKVDKKYLDAHEAAGESGRKKPCPNYLSDKAL